ncbi:MAG: menaquinone biosynthesis decarboxylase [Bacteroidetes bacterium]|nr:menaquinone biosynthesis decarboxylase [Bacteroidota bacterium]
MKFPALNEFLKYLESIGELHRIKVEVDPELESTEIAIRALKQGKPALLFENPKGSKYPLAMNILASERRIEHALGMHPEELGEKLIGFMERAIPPKLNTILEHKQIVKRLISSRPKKVSSGFAQEVVDTPNLTQLPIQKCWSQDGGRFITLGQVMTYDPVTQKRNIGVYRMQMFDDSSTGMHWQIQKGGGFHYFQAQKLGKEFELAVVLGSDPTLLLASVAALPEGIDEVMFAGFLRGARIPMTRGKTISVDVPANAEFILEGKVSLTESKLEGPFGDHFGHYSAASEFPVFRLNAITHRRNPIYPGTVVGRPPMEDKFLGDATQQILGPLIRLMHPEIRSLWAYYEAGFHNLLVVEIEERYAKEAAKTAMSLIGEGQLSLTKCIVTVSAGVNPKDWNSVLKEIRENFDPHYDFIMIPKVPLDTLDFTSYKMNLGSKMVIDACRKQRAESPDDVGINSERRAKSNQFGGMRPDKVGMSYEQRAIQNLKSPPVPNVRDSRAGQISNLKSIDRRIIDVNLIENTLLIVKIESQFTPQSTQHSNTPIIQHSNSSLGREVVEKLVALPKLSSLKLIAVVSEDVDIRDKESYIWGIFTRFDCERDIIFTEQKLVGISPVYSGVMGIDATWKTGYQKPLVMDERIVKLVDAKWGKIWKKD